MMTEVNAIPPLKIFYLYPCIGGKLEISRQLQAGDSDQVFAMKNLKFKENYYTNFL